MLRIVLISFFTAGLARVCGMRYLDGLENGKSFILRVIWLAITWNIWKHRNNVVFNGIILNAFSLLDDIKTYFWVWFSGQFVCNSCIPFSDWCQDHMSFF
jgi:hypothetical protein